MSAEKVVCIEQLKKKRLDLVRVHKENNFTEGIHSLLTDLYPDTAHYIYELLQNAEDMDASAVRFELSQNGVMFEHNGTKRSFIIDDIDAITNIGSNSIKKSDETSIGKFGVGFKSVFAYTNTPEIHSGKFHFKIEDYFIPQTEGVEKINTIDNVGVEWTKFWLPFDSDRKPKERAFIETRNNLLSLDETSILFLNNIKNIDFKIDDEGEGYVRLDSTKNICSIISKNFKDGERRAYYFRHSKKISFINENGIEKQLSLAVSYALCKNDKGYTVVPVNNGGKTFIYFPAEKEYSGLKFNINAPFASTVARDSVRECEINDRLMKELANVVCESIELIKSEGLLTFSFLNVLPNDEDELSPFYSIIRDAVYNCFIVNNYLISTNGEYISAKDGLISENGEHLIFDTTILNAVLNIHKSWISIENKLSRACTFIKSLDVEQFTEDMFNDLFTESKLYIFEKIITLKNDKWLKKFYRYCYDIYKYYNKRPWYYRELIYSLRGARIIKANDGYFYNSKEIYLPPEKNYDIEQDIHIVDFQIMKKNNKIVDEKIASLFEEILLLEQYGTKSVIEKKITKYASSLIPGKEYFEDLLLFAKYNKSNNDIDFGQHSIFLYEEDETLYCTKASSLIIGIPYIDINNTIIAMLYNRKYLWKGYIEAFKEEELKLFLEFISDCGALETFEIEKQRVYYHPEYRSKLYSYGNDSYYKIDEDYTIRSVNNILKSIDIETSKLLWQTLLNNSSIKYTKAIYRPNKSIPKKVCESSLVYYLKNYEWVPDKDGILRKPEWINVNEIRDDFKYDPNNEILKALGFGSKQTEQKEEELAFENEAARRGFIKLPPEELELFEEFKKQMARKRENKPEYLVKELLEKQEQHTEEKRSNSTRSITITPESITSAVEYAFDNIDKGYIAKNKIHSSISITSNNEKALLEEWYFGECQICGEKIISRKGKPYFITKDLISTKDLSNELIATIPLGWNAICLCPNCAAKFDVCTKNISNVESCVLTGDVNEEGVIDVPIRLDGKEETITYNEAHLSAVQKAFELINKRATK